jgi:hypothetical protein
MVPGEADRNDLEFVYVLLELKSFRSGDRYDLLETLKEARCSCHAYMCIYIETVLVQVQEEVVISVNLKGNSSE